MDGWGEDTGILEEREESRDGGRTCTPGTFKVRGEHTEGGGGGGMTLTKSWMRLSWVRNVWIWNSRTTVSKTEFHRIPFNATVLCFHEYSQTLLWLFFSIKKLILPQRETTLLPPVWTHYNLRSQSVIILTPGCGVAADSPPCLNHNTSRHSLKHSFTLETIRPQINSPSNLSYSPLAGE